LSDFSAALGCASFNSKGMARGRDGSDHQMIEIANENRLSWIDYKCPGSIGKAIEAEMSRWNRTTI
jgi:hypothetical protein